ncbi:hypothetical protein BH23ACI1_BH23ACI1_27500 [soil metagenome]
MESPDDRLSLNYEPEHDLLSVWVGTSVLADSVEVEPGVCVRVSNDGTVVGLQVVDAAARLHKDARTLESPTYARQLLRALNELDPSHAR